MQFRLTYREVEQLFERKMGKSLPLSYNDNRTIRISYAVPLMGSVDLWYAQHSTRPRTSRA